MIAANRNVIERLSASLREPLPGHGAFIELGGYQRPDIDEVLRRTPPPKESAVLVLLYEEREELRTLLMLRPTYDGVHSGQVAFPGGHREAGDADLRQTALREFSEEIGVATSLFVVLGELTRVFIPPSNTLVTPVLAYSESLGAPSPDPNEVAELIPVPINEMLRDDLLKRRTLFVNALKREAEVPYWDISGHVVWGATALMIAELRELLHRLR